ncbi:MAG: adenosine deaminase [Mangrovicoccus sp.]|nr:adenosine deaminase [Mangrovicoccus sp.]
MTRDRIELHLHLEGAAPPKFIAGLAAEKSINLDGVFAEDGGYAFDGFAHFLEVYEAATSVLKSPQDYARLTQAVLEEQAAQGILYTEVFVSPAFCGEYDLGAWAEYLAAMGEAAAKAEAQDGVILRAIATPVRHFGPDAAREAAACARESAGEFLVGFGMGGAEQAGRVEEFAYAFDMAREAELHLTCHAGEWAGPEAIRDTLKHLDVARLGHGVRAVEDEALVDDLAERGTVLELCPGSNIALGLYPNWRAHPIERLRARGVKVTVSTDDPPFFRTSMSQEYARLAEAFDWDDAEFARLNRVAAEAAFCDEETKSRLIKALEPKDV